jgi:hypothetical protein
MHQANRHEIDVDALGKQLGLQLPAGTQVLGVETESAIDDAIFAKLRIPAERSGEFIKSCGVTRFRPGGANLLGPDHGFWDPHHATALRVGDVPLPTTRGLVVAIDESSPEALIVYVMNHST